MNTNIPIASQQMTAAQSIVECMKIEGITNAYCVPGESYLPLLDALHDEESIRLIATRHEGGAAFMAEGYAKAALKPAVVLATRGVGAANLSIGVHTAYQDSTPMVVFLGQVHRKFRGREGFQEVDLDQFFQSIAKWTVEISDSDRVPELVQRAFRVAQSGRPGPVVVSLPEDILAEEIEAPLGPKSTIPRPSPSRRELEDVEKILAATKAPVIIAGGGVKWAKAEEQLVNFAEKFTIPVITAFRRHDVFPNNHPLYAGHLGLGTQKEVKQVVEDADVIIALGTRLSEVTTQDYQLITPEKLLIHVDIDHSVIGKSYAPDLGIIADIGEALNVWYEMKLKPTWTSWAGKCNQAYKETSKLTATDSDTIYQQVFHSLIENLPKNAIITNDAGNFAGWLHAYYRFTEKNTYVGPTSGAMGYGLPAALGAKLAQPEKTVVSLSGDGGFMMTVQELETAVRESIPVIAIVFNNNMYGTIRMHQEIHYPERVTATDLGQVSFSKLAQSVGANGYTVNTISEFNLVLQEALQNKGPMVIEVLTEKEQISVSSTITDLRNRRKKQ